MRGNIVTRRINRAIELLAQCQAICYVGRHTGHRLTHDRGRLDAHIWADYINVGMEHGSFDMAGLVEYMRGLVDGGPTRSGHHTPAVIVEVRSTAPTRPMCASTPGSSAKSSAAAFTESLLCQAESAGAVRAFVEACRYPHHSAGVDPNLPLPIERMHGATREAASGRLGPVPAVAGRK
jgi:hypothetical protein